MSCSVIIQNMNGDERRVYVDSEEELKYMNIEEFIRRVCFDDESVSRTRHRSVIQKQHHYRVPTRPGKLRSRDVVVEKN